MLRSLIITQTDIAKFYKKNITYLVIVKNIKIVSINVQVSEIYAGEYFLNTQKQAHAHVYVIRGIYNTHALK
jgi:hypothetical protein